MDTKYKIVGVLSNNGLTSFAPPCFSWEVTDCTGALIDTFSEVELMSTLRASIQSSDPWDLVGLQVHGYVETYAPLNALPQGARTGRRLILTKVDTAV